MLDVSNPSQVSVVWEYDTEGMILDIEVHDSLAFVLAYNYLLVFDLTNPTNPVNLSRVPIWPGLSDVKIEGSFAFIASFTGFVLCVDISDPSLPFLRSYIGTGFRTTALAIKWPYVYAGGEIDTYLSLINATNPDSLTVDVVEAANGLVTALAVRDSILCVSEAGGFRVYSVAIPGSPVFLGQLALDKLQGIELKDSLAYCLSSYPGIVSTVNIADPTSPQLLSSVSRTVPLIETGSGISVLGNKVYAACYSGLFIVDVSRPDSISEISFWGTNAGTADLVRKGNNLFLASNASGLLVLDVSDPSEPTTVSNIQTGGVAFSLDVDSGFVYLSNKEDSSYPDSLEGIWIINVQNPKFPAIVSTIPIPGALHVVKHGDYLFVTRNRSVSNDTMMQIINVSSPLFPVTVGAVHGDYTVYEFTVTDNLVLAASADSGLMIIDWSVPGTPTIISNPTKRALGVLVEGNTAYVDKADSLLIMDITDPSVPVVIGKTRRGYGSFSGGIRLAKSDSYLVWAAGGIGLFDVSDPTNPFDYGHCPSIYPMVVSAASETLFVGYSVRGVSIVQRDVTTSVNNDIGRNTNPNQTLNLHVYPNPFNPTTWISFSLGIRQHVSLELFDVLGRKVRSLLDETVDAGENKILLSGEGISTGVYLLVLRSHFGTDLQKVVFVK